MKMRGVESLADYEWTGQPGPASLRRALRHALRRASPELRVITEDFLAESTHIDLLAVGASGELVSIRATADTAPSSAAQLFVRGLGDTIWLRRRVSDLAKLAPELGLRPNTLPRVMLFATDFDEETISATQAVTAGQIDVYRYRCMKLQGQLTLLIERVQPGAVAIDSDALDGGIQARQMPTIDDRAKDVDAPAGLTGPPSPSAFRTGLTDADLKLAPPIGVPAAAPPSPVAAPSGAPSTGAPLPAASHAGSRRR